MNVALFAAVALAAGPAPAPSQLFEFQDPRILESSGIAASSRSDQVYFTHNDSGDSARFFAVDVRGCTIGTFTAPSVTAIDWEDMARGPGPDGTPSLFLGDIGDNAAGRTELAVYRFAEPEVGPVTTGPGECPAAPEQPLEPAAFRLAYEDGPHDAETLLVHPRTGQLFVITKNFAGPEALYAAPPTLVAGEINVLRKVADVVPPTYAPGDSAFAPTGGDIAPDLSSVAVRSYGGVYFWKMTGDDVAAAFGEDAEVVQIRAPDAGRQGEALAFTRTGTGLVASSEGSRAPVYLIPRPAFCDRLPAVTLVPARSRGRAVPLRTARATVDGKRARVTVRGAKVRISLAGVERTSGRATVRITARTRSGRRVTVTRRVAVCR